MAQKTALSYYQRNKPNTVVDLLALLFLFGSGIAGLIYVATPVEEQIAHPPMLTDQDWPTGKSLSGIQEVGHYSDDRVERVFEEELAFREASGSPRATIWQRTIWYTDPLQARQQWQTASGEQAPAASEDGKPISKLVCEETAGLSCRYYAYSGHWFTHVWFWSLSNSKLSEPTMHELIQRVDELLLSAPPTP